MERIERLFDGGGQTFISTCLFYERTIKEIKALQIKLTFHS